MTNYHNLHRRKSCLNKHNATTWRAKDKMNVSVTQWFPNCEPQLILPRGAANYYNFIFFIISPDRRTSSAIRRVIWIWIWLRWQPIRQKEWEGDFENDIITVVVRNITQMFVCWCLFVYSVSKKNTRPIMKWTNCSSLIYTEQHHH